MSWNLADAKNWQSAWKLSYTWNLRGKAFIGRYFMALWFVEKVVWFVLATMLEGILLPSDVAAKTTFCLYLIKRLIVTLRCVLKTIPHLFNNFLEVYKCKISVQKEVIHRFKNHILVTWPATNLIILRKWCGFEN